MYLTIAIFQELWFPRMGNGFQQILKGIHLSNFKQYQKALTRESKMFHWIKVTLFKFRICCVAWFGSHYYNKVNSSKNATYKRSRKTYTSLLRIGYENRLVICDSPLSFQSIRIIFIIFPCIEHYLQERF